MRCAAILAAFLTLVTSCHQEGPNRPVRAETPETKPTRAAETRESAWNGARPTWDWQYDRKVAEAKRQGKWPPLKARKYRVYLFQDQRWKVAATVDSFDSADALRKAIQFIPEDYYDLPVAVLPADENLPAIDTKLPY